MDLAWDVPFKQITPTLLGNILQKGEKAATVEEAEKMLTSFGVSLENLIVNEEDPKNPGRQIKRINFGLFTDIYVPLVKSYVTMRWARITNDRNKTPFLEYLPAFSNAKSRMQCEAVTSRVEQMSRQYGAFNGFKQGTFHVLHYGTMLEFPVEEWHSEEQETADIEMAVKDDAGKARLKNGKMYRIVREGVRHHYPHPTRFSFDQAYPPSSFNTDTGCEFGMYWRVRRYRDVRSNTKFWNRDKIAIGTTPWWTNWSAFWENVYPTAMKFAWPDLTQSGGAAGDRETQISDNYYTQSFDDKAIVLTEYFEKLIPSDWGIGNYDFPVWFRFVVGADDTILYAAPMPYSPIKWAGYDPDENRAQNSSMTLETLPFQDHMGNLLTQYLLAVKQNLANATFVDTDVVGKEWIARIRNWGEKIQRVINFIPFSGREAIKSQHGTPNAFFSHKFQPLDTASIVQAMKLLLDLLERVLVMSSMEVGQASTHEQTKREIDKIDESKTTRVVFTATPLDQWLDSKKEQLYEALMAFGSDDFYAQVPMEPKLDKDVLEKLGFTYNQQDHPATMSDRKVIVRAKKSAIAYLSFASKHDDATRSNGVEVGTAMLNALTGLLSGPLGPNIGPDQALTIINLAAKMMGFPKDFKLENAGPPSAQDQQSAIQKQLEEFAAQVQQETQAALGEVMNHIKLDEKAIAKLQADMQKFLTMAPPRTNPAQYDDPALLASAQPVPAGPAPIVGQPVGI